MRRSGRRRRGRARPPARPPLGPTRPQAEAGRTSAGRGAPLRTPATGLAPAAPAAAGRRARRATLARRARRAQSVVIHASCSHVPLGDVGLTGCRSGVLAPIQAAEAATAARGSEALGAACLPAAGRAAGARAAGAAAHGQPAARAGRRVEHAHGELVPPRRERDHREAFARRRRRRRRAVVRCPAASGVALFRCLSHVGRPALCRLPGTCMGGLVDCTSS